MLHIVVPLILGVGGRYWNEPGTAAFALTVKAANHVIGVTLLSAQAAKLGKNKSE